MKHVEPVSRVAVIQNVRLYFAGYQNAVDRMKQQRDKNTEDLDEQKIRHVVNILNMVVEDLRAIQRRRVCVQMDEIEKPERHDAGQLVNFSQQEGFAEFYRHSWSEPEARFEEPRIRRSDEQQLYSSVFILFVKMCYRSMFRAVAKKNRFTGSK